MALAAIGGGIYLTNRGMRKRTQEATKLTLGPLKLEGGGPGLAVVALGVSLGIYTVWDGFDFQGAGEGQGGQGGQSTDTDTGWLEDTG